MLHTLSSPPRSHQRATVEDCPDEDGSVRRLSHPTDCDTLLCDDSDSDSDSEDDHAADMRFPPPSSSPIAPSPSVPRTAPTRDLRNGILRQAPTIEEAQSALAALRLKFHKCRPNGIGWIPLALDPFERDRYEGMRNMLSFYTDKLSKTHGHWAASSLQAAVTMCRGPYCARILRQMVRAFIADRTVLPLNPYGDWKMSMLCDQDLANDICLYLQELGDEITAAKVAAYLNRQAVKDKHGISKSVSERTARRWLRTLGYRYRFEARGQYVDGHERKDVVWYRAHVYIPAIKSVCSFSVLPIEFLMQNSTCHASLSMLAARRFIRSPRNSPTAIVALCFGTTMSPYSMRTTVVGSPSVLACILPMY